jgi:hypothetical protein
MDVISDRNGVSEPPGAIAPGHSFRLIAVPAMRRSLWLVYAIRLAFFSISYVSINIFLASTLVDGCHALICAHRPRQNNSNRCRELAASGRQCTHRFISS